MEIVMLKSMFKGVVIWQLVKVQMNGTKHIGKN
jgi:hypothetical protein